MKVAFAGVRKVVLGAYNDTGFLLVNYMKIVRVIGEGVATAEVCSMTRTVDVVPNFHCAAFAHLS
jgi:hypothetical protein